MILYSFDFRTDIHWQDFFVNTQGFESQYLGLSPVQTLEIVAEYYAVETF